MTIHHFAAHQNDVFVPALLAALVATLLLVLPVVFGPAVRRSTRGRVLAGLGVVLAIVALGFAGWQAGIGFRTLADERARVGTELRDDFGLTLDARQVGQLVDGDQLRLARLPDGKLHFRSDGGDDYTLLLGTRPLPRQA